MQKIVYNKRHNDGRLSPMVMLQNIAKVAGQTLTSSELDRIKDIPARNLYNVYADFMRSPQQDNAKFIIDFLLR